MLLAATAPDSFVIQPHTLSYDAGAILYREAVYQTIGNTEAESFVDLRVDEVGDQTFRISDVGDVYDYDPTSELPIVIRVDPDLTYRINASTNDLPEIQSFELGYVAVDTDDLPILPVHVNKLAGAVDTHLLRPITPGDTSIVIADATGWSNEFGKTAQSRALAWYGYQDGQGTTYDDFTYTRNVLGDVVNGAWEDHGIAFDASVGGYRITLSQSWAGDPVPVGTAIRNAVASDDQFQIPVDRFNNTDINFYRSYLRYELTNITSAFGGVPWSSESNHQRGLPPGTAAIKLSPSLPSGQRRDWLRQ